MDRCVLRGLALPAAALLLAAGCAHVISTEVRQTARADLTFPAVHQDPEAYRGETVIWGGVIIETLNQREGTLVTLLETPLDSQGFPGDAEYSRGRFMVRAASYLDPEVFRRGVKMTLAGTVVGREVKPLGEIQYAYPVLSAREMHIWKERPYYYYPYPPWGFHWGYPYWYWRGW